MTGDGRERRARETRDPGSRDHGAGVFRSAPAHPAAAAAVGQPQPGVHAELVHVHVPFTAGGGSRPGIRPGAFVPPFAGGSEAAVTAVMAAYDALMRRPYDHRQVLGRGAVCVFARGLASVRDVGCSAGGMAMGLWLTDADSDALVKG